MLTNSCLLWREAESIYHTNGNALKEGYSYEHMIAEIFAELLAKECIAMCDSVRNGPDVDMAPQFRDGVTSGATRVKYLIAKQFGINPRAKLTTI